MGDIELTSAELDELERLAKAATPGPWFQTGAPWFRDGSGVLAGSPDGNVAYLIADTDDFGLPRDEYEGFPLGDKEDDAAYIASANPATILRLLSLARAGIEAGKAEEWQPIKTAPKDGTHILIARIDPADLEDGADFMPEGVIVHWARFPDGWGWYANGLGVETDAHVYFPGNGKITDNGWEELRPTHWRKLPRPAIRALPLTGGEE